MTLTLNDNINTMYQLQQSAVRKPVVDFAVSKDEETPKQYHRRKNGVVACTALGIAASIAVLAKLDKKKFSLSPKKIFATPIKDTYLGSVKYGSKEVIGMGIGSCLGGLLGGALFDKRKDKNMKSKVEEAVVGITNISMPIMFVEGLSHVGEKVTNRMQNWVKKGGLGRKIIAESPKVAGSMIGLISGMYLGNRLSHQINKHVFGKKEDDRPIKIQDFAAHIDDVCVAATFVAQGNPLTKAVSRIIPVALGVAGTEVGNK